MFGNISGGNNVMFPENSHKQIALDNAMLLTELWKKITTLQDDLIITLKKNAELRLEIKKLKGEV